MQCTIIHFIRVGYSRLSSYQCHISIIRPHDLPSRGRGNPSPDVRTREKTDTDLASRGWSLTILINLSEHRLTRTSRHTSRRASHISNHGRFTTIQRSPLQTSHSSRPYSNQRDSRHRPLRCIMCPTQRRMVKLQTVKFVRFSPLWALQRPSPRHLGS